MARELTQHHLALVEMRSRGIRKCWKGAISSARTESRNDTAEISHGANTTGPVQRQCHFCARPESDFCASLSVSVADCASSLLLLHPLVWCLPASFLLIDVILLTLPSADQPCCFCMITPHTSLSSSLSCLFQQPLCPQRFTAGELDQCGTCGRPPLPCLYDVGRLATTTTYGEEGAQFDVEHGGAYRVIS